MFRGENGWLAGNYEKKNREKAAHSSLSPGSFLLILDGFCTLHIPLIKTANANFILQLRAIAHCPITASVPQSGTGAYKEGH